MNSVIIPSRDEAAKALGAIVTNLDRLGVAHEVSEDQEIDWAEYIETAQESLNLSGSGMRSGTIYLSDSYPLRRTLNLDSHVALEGRIRA